MCGRYQLSLPLDDLESIFDATGKLPVRPRYNIAPTQVAPVVRPWLGQREIVGMRWGLIPPWSTEGLKGKPLINARSETVSEKPSFRDALQRGRCLVPATGFYEWRRAGRKKIPYLIRTRDEPVFAMAGIASRWRGPDGLVDSVAVLTVDPLGALGTLHDRMPVILSPAALDRWLDPTASKEEILRLLQPLTADALTIIEVSDRVNSVRHDDASCEQPAAIQPTLW